MALKRNERYAGRFSNPTTAHPQGAFKNRTAPGSQDGSYLEQDWANDWDGFFSSLLSAAGVTPNGNVDAVGASQYFDALKTVIPGVLVGAPKIFTASGLYTVTPGTKSIIVECVGGGGGGGGAQAGSGFASFGGGGGAGGYGKSRYVNPDPSYSLVVGQGGLGGGGTANGVGGSATSFGTLMTVPGGNPGQTAAAGTTPYIIGSLGASQAVTGANIVGTGTSNTGGLGWRLDATNCTGGTGADTLYGRGGDTASTINRAGGNGVGYGSGGGGGRAVNNPGVPYPGGNGAGGIIIVWEYR